MKCNLEIEKIFIEKLNFELNSKKSISPSLGNVTVEYRVNFMVQLKNLEKGLVKLICLINEKEFNNDSADFKMETSIIGLFNTNEEHIKEYFLENRKVDAKKIHMKYSPYDE